jgi:SAM-dependent methyltransferase
MHYTAMENGRRFFETYVSGSEKITLVEIGAMDVCGTLRSVSPPNAHYIGADLAEGKGVDIVLPDPYSLPFADESIDVVVSSSCFEHAELFWLVFLEIMRVLKPAGLFYLNAPSNGPFHRVPIDCWRFYPDAGKALVTWARRSGIQAALLESFTGKQRRDVWNDYVAVFVKDEAHAKDYPNRILSSITGFSNGTVYGGDGFRQYKEFPEDMTLHALWKLPRDKAKLAARAALRALRGGKPI